MDLHISVEGRRDLAGQVYRQVRAAIMEGRLLAGQALPSSRELARRLAVSRNTIGVAYDRLVAEGFLVCRIGVGTYVSADISPNGQSRRVGSPLRPRPLWDAISPGPDMSKVRPEFDFRSGVADVRQFPFDTWRGLVARQLRTGAVGTAAHIDAAGEPALREALARHVGVSRGVSATAADVFVTNGSQQAIDLVTRILLEPGDTVAVENPGYVPAMRAFVAHGARLAAVPVDSEGMVVDRIPDGVRLVYVCPSHQFPLGMAMSLPRRLALLDWAERTGAAILEDDYDSEFRYAGRPLEPLHSLDHAGRVLYTGSLSKVMLPTFRLGFLVAPEPLHLALRKAKHAADWHTAVPMQAAAAEFIDNGLLARHIRRMRGIYAERHHRITVALHRDFADHLVPILSGAGLHLAALLRRGDDRPGDDVALERRAAAAGIAFEALSRFAVGPPQWTGMTIGYGAIPTDRIDEGLARLRECVSAEP